MNFLTTIFSVIVLLASATLLKRPLPSSNLIKFQPLNVTESSVHNIRIDHGNVRFSGKVRILYGACNITKPVELSQEVGLTFMKHGIWPDRLIWIVPQEIVSLGCLHAFHGNTLIGRSLPIQVLRNHTTAFNKLASWFNETEYLRGHQRNVSFAHSAKRKRIAIVGAGLAGLLTSLLLSSVGIHNWHITESSNRIGGRIRTKYFNGTQPGDYQYQELGAMRLPFSTYHDNSNETIEINHQKMVLYLGETLNRINNVTFNQISNLSINFIPWYESSPNVPADSNGIRLSDGRIPTMAQLEDSNSTISARLGSFDRGVSVQAKDAIEEFKDYNEDRLKAAAKNIFEAYQESLRRGLLNFTEYTYLRYILKVDADSSDSVAGASAKSPMWDLQDRVYDKATTWLTVDKGLESIPRAFMPHVRHKLTLNRKVDGLSYDTKSGKISIQWRSNPVSIAPQSEEYDYAIISVPFSRVRGWSLPTFSSLLYRAITTLNYEQSCKVALEYKTRFWEHAHPPIYGGCGSTDIYGGGRICYPSYGINSSRPGVVLASYVDGTPARFVASLTAEDHVARIQRTMVEVHGKIAETEWTGSYARYCWEDDEHQAGAWASPLLGQQELYRQAYYNTEFNTIFIGEHTSFINGWMFSALESAVRGTVQLLLDMGLVDEATDIRREWIDRWL